MKIEKHVEFLGWITEPEKSLVLEHSNLFVMTPTIVGESVEGFGMAFIDAAFHGVASVGTNSGGIADAIIDRETGLLCEPGNQADITEKIRNILTDTSLRENFGNKGKEIANNHYTWQHKIEEYLKEV